MQLYAADTATGVTLPAQQLVGFARLDLEPGESKTVTFVVPMSLLAYSGFSGDVVMEPGPVELGAGSGSDDIRSAATFTVSGQERTISGDERAFLSATIVGPRTRTVLARRRTRSRDDPDPCGEAEPDVRARDAEHRMDGAPHAG